MSYKHPPYPISVGGTGATTLAGAQSSLGIPAVTAVMLLNGTQSMAASLNAGGYTIQNAATPINPTDVATREYVDTTVFNSFFLMGA